MNFLGIFTCLGLLAYVAEQAGRAQRWERHTYEVLENTRNLKIGLRDAEVGQHGFLLTGEANLLALYNEALGRIGARQDDLRRLTADNAVQQARLADLLPAIGQQVERFEKAIALRNAADPEAALERVREDLTSPLGRRINAELDAFVAEERPLLAARLAEVDRIHTVAFWFALAVAVSGAGTLLIAIWLLRRTVHRALAAEAAQRSLALQLNSSFESISQGVAVFDMQRRLVRWNDCFIILLGLPRELVREDTTYAELSQCLYARKQVLQPKRLLVEQLFNDLRTLLARTLGPHINVVVALRGPVPAIQVDPNHLQTALLNSASMPATPCRAAAR